ncbi:uncharacterized protein BCR38DRAFT_6178 [Pseudomassariella vexata]|uniref:Uncharacterized protein n=1 Tax=Pseudomassariella vexata TaxID=1141098 RepID=A0A1Y2EIH2_9PEZI|nr:uncharacterized protein BCR38DRAFT_6178 [Pseudomassariella vexata]ORY71237.1 hypothetical protein BCR38DRAFT_6178 [Pseudomassariella vexata]
MAYPWCTERRRRFQQIFVIPYPEPSRSQSWRQRPDLRNHLRRDRRQNEAERFRYTAFLKEQLKMTKGIVDSSKLSTSIKLYVAPILPQNPELNDIDFFEGALPRQLLLETLGSIQGILFPLNDSKPRRLLESSVNTGSSNPRVPYRSVVVAARGIMESTPTRVAGKADGTKKWSEVYDDSDSDRCHLRSHTGYMFSVL